MESSQLPKDTPTELLIGGSWVPGHGRFPVADPATLTDLAEVADAGVDEGLAAVDAAAVAFPDWAARPAREGGFHGIHEFLEARYLAVSW